MPLEAEGEESSTMVTEEERFPPLRIPQDVLKATVRFQSTIDCDVLHDLVGRISKV